MREGFAAALRGESFVMWRSLGPRLLLLGPALAVFLHLSLAKLVAGNAPDAQTNGYGYMVDGFSTGLILLYLGVVAYAAFSFAAERDFGTLRQAVIRGASRRAVLAAKFAVLAVLSALAALLVLLAATLLARLYWELGPVVEDGFEIIGVELIREEIGRGLLLALTPLPAALALGLLISVLARSATQAITLALGVTLAVDMFKELMGDWRHYLYLSFQPSLMDDSYLSEVARIVRGYSDVLLDPGVQQLNLWLPLPQAAVLAALALVVVGRRKL